MSDPLTFPHRSLFLIRRSVTLLARFSDIIKGNNSEEQVPFPAGCSENRHDLRFTGTVLGKPSSFQVPWRSKEQPVGSCLESLPSDAGAGRSLQVPGQPELHNKTLSPPKMPQEHLPTFGYAFCSLQFVICSQATCRSTLGERWA